MRASLFVTCLVDLFQPSTGVAAVKLLRAAGCDVSCPMGQTCCGQPAWNSGFVDDAAKVARASMEALEADGADVVIVPAGSCATMIKVFWPEMFELTGDAHAAERARALGGRVRELSDFLDERRRAGALPGLCGAATSAPPEGSAASAPTVAYHHSCHMLRELGIEGAPVALAEAAGCTVADWPDDKRCCGFGGLFSMKLPETSVAMADEKLRSLPDGIEMLVGSDGSCLMHLRARAEKEGRTLAVRHLAEVLADVLDSRRASDGAMGDRAADAGSRS